MYDTNHDKLSSVSHVNDVPLHQNKPFMANWFHRPSRSGMLRTTLL